MSETQGRDSVLCPQVEFQGEQDRPYSLSNRIWSLEDLSLASREHSSDYQPTGCGSNRRERTERQV